MEIISRVRVVTEPEVEPVTLAEAKLWCRVDDDDTSQDAMLLLLIKAVRERAEELTGRAFAQRTLELRLDAFPDGVIELPFPPLQSVTSISHIDSSGALQTSGSPTDFQEDLTSEPGRVAPLTGTAWPSTQEVLNAVRVRYVAGYATVNAIPKLARLWMQARISTFYEHREQLVVGGQLTSLPRDFVDGLLDGLRVTKNFA